MEIAGIFARLAAQPHPVLAIELQWGESGYDGAAGRWPAVLDLCGIVAAPGWQDSRFRSLVVAELPANDQGERSSAVAYADALARQLGVAYCPPELGPDGGSPGRSGYSRWMAGQGPAPSVDFDVHWQALYRRDDGTAEHADGVEVAGGDCGTEALAVAAHALHRRLGSDDGPVYLRCSIPALALGTGRPAPSPGGTLYHPRRELDVSSAEVRDQRLAGEPPARIARWVLGRAGTAAEPTALAVMWAMHRAFDVPLAELEEVGRWHLGQLPDDELDAVVGPCLDRAEPQWSLPSRIRQAHRSGAGAGPVLRAALAELGPILPVRYLREAYDHSIGLTEAAAIVDAARRGDDAAVADLLAAT